MAITIGSTTYPSLRAAINAAGSSDTINVTAGSYAITNYTGVTDTINYGIPGLARFQSSSTGLSGLTLAGAGAATTTITGLERIYVAAKDLGFGIPTNWTIKDLNLTFNFIGTSEYILQAGAKQYTNGVLTGALAPVTDLKLQNLIFTGTHRGNSGSNGNYIDMAGATNLLLDNVVVDLVGQQTYVAGTATTLSSGGSAFLFAQGTSMKVQNKSIFNEAGYSNSITFYDSTGFTVDDNTFDAQGQRKQRGQIFSNSDGTVSRNSFLNGTHLDLLNVNTKAISITNNTFNAGTTTFGLGVVIDSGQVLADLRNITATGNFFKDVVPFTSLISEASSGGSGATPQLRFQGVNNVWNPSLGGGTGANESFSRFLVGGTGDDILAGNIPSATGSVKDFITGGPGNDTLTGGTGADAFAFTTPLNAATNVDTITDFRAPGAGADKIWLDDSIFTSLPKGALAPGHFGTGAAGGVDVVYDATTKGLYFAAGGAGSLSGYTQFATLGGTSTITPGATDFVVF